MSRIDAPISATLDAEPRRTTSRSVAEWLELASDRLNPILVKEARQALKGRAFAVTFIAVLVLAWTWSIFGVALQSPGIYYAPGGAYMLMGYLAIMALPLIVVVPFSAFRSMAAEREDGTFELVSITKLKPWQLITGKLSSATLQILIYLSALAPCVAFTYFLRGVDIFMIAMLVVVGILESLLLSALGLLMAAQTRPQRMQNAASVALLSLLAVAACATCSIEFGMLASGVTLPVRDPQAWVVAAAVLSTWGCVFWLLVLSAAAALTFASDNRATLLRVATLCTHALWFGWMTWVWQTNQLVAEIVYMYLLPMTVFWWLCGSCISGERTMLTPRVRRELPRTSLGKLFGMLFFPGRGLGYFFVVGNVLTMGGVSALIGWFSEGGQDADVLTTSLLCSSYVIAYTGVGNLLMRLSGKYHLEGPLRGVFANFAVMVFGTLIPLSIHLSYPRKFGQEYSLIEISNVFWTVVESMEGDIGLTPASTNPYSVIPYLVAMFAGIVVILNLLFAAREMNLDFVAVPRRVAEELAVGVDVMAQPMAESPWDEPDAC